mmetsp:Transcript_10594/g.20089  ORF Transcript_10594/g.20089 Transcript_10594/m.20089 type:complete len:124 (+) Transcript_10594:195-566(+)|eukprot:CAMPEP_0114236778 /NCGR_PEP_ID=MMETSP0058-20121206/7032_1 /TAXON_ID=36894 /ORGANISM="Pyramimonas parkeae, CCMP726" /LENGTH=123 /DNA_ID=CAMNT_0001348763 /DNA_START=133 /DNA_END=504 /DNA_ORIENTATION=-
MAYNLYSTQMADGWKQRIDKERSTVKKTDLESALGPTGARRALNAYGTFAHDMIMQDMREHRRSPGVAPSYSGTRTTIRKQTELQDRLRLLEAELTNEKLARLKLECEIKTVQQMKVQKHNTG